MGRAARRKIGQGVWVKAIELKQTKQTNALGQKENIKCQKSKKSKK